MRAERSVSSSVRSQNGEHMAEADFPHRPYFEAPKKESAELQLAVVCPAAKAVRRVPVPLLFSFKPHVERYYFRGWQTPVLDLGSAREEVFTDDPARPAGSRREDRAQPNQYLATGGA